MISLNDREMFVPFFDLSDKVSVAMCGRAVYWTVLLHLSMIYGLIYWRHCHHLYRDDRFLLDYPLSRLFLLASHKIKVPGLSEAQNQWSSSTYLENQIWYRLDESILPAQKFARIFHVCVRLFGSLILRNRRCSVPVDQIPTKVFASSQN